MRLRCNINLVTYGLLAAACGVSILLPGTLSVPAARAQSGPPEYVLSGIVRDFASTHPDFNIVPPLGFGHYAGNIDTWLPLGTNRPVFNGAGYKVDAEWRDMNSNPIAPHMAGAQAGVGLGEQLGFRVSSNVELRGNSFIDAFDSNYGPYGVAGNFGADALITTNAIAASSVDLQNNTYIRGSVMVGPGGVPSSVINNQGIITGNQGALTEAQVIPDVDLPANSVDGLDLQPFLPILTVVGPMTLTGDLDLEDDVYVAAMWIGQMILTENSLLTVQGHLRIRVDGNFLMDKADIRLLPDSSLTLYVSGNAIIEDSSRVNVVPGNPSAVSLNLKGAGQLRVRQNSEVYATVVAPLRSLEMTNFSAFFGSYLGQSMFLDQSNAHVDDGNILRGYQNFALAVRDKVEIEDNSEVDSFDSTLGPYGPMNMGENALVSTNHKGSDHVKVKNNSIIHGSVLVGPSGNPAQVIDVDGTSSITGSQGVLTAPIGIPLVTAPFVGADQGHLHWTDGLARTISADMRCRHLKLENGTVVTIDGNITIRCDGKVEIKKNSHLVLTPGSTLTLYIKDDLKVEDNSSLNMTNADPSKVWVPRMGYGKDGVVQIKNNSQAAAWIQGNKAELVVESTSEFFGSFVGKRAKVKDWSKFHVDAAGVADCINVGDTFGVAGSASTEAITDAASFSQWFQDVLGVNMAKVHSITMTNDGTDVYEYLNSGFYPIDGQLLGNESGTRNDFFTYTMAADFVYEACAGQWIDFQGGDGVWMFVNNQLVVDLGGVTAFDPQIIELDRMGLSDGQTYTVNMFYAHRNSFSAVFRLRTNLELYSKGVPPITAMFD